MPTQETSPDPQLKDLLGHVVDQRASDLYLIAGSPPMVRVEGMVLPVNKHPLSPGDIHDIARSIVSDRQWERFSRGLELNLALPVEADARARFRVNLLRQRASTAIVIRRVDLRIPTVDELGLPAILNGLALEPRGLVLVVGATGSGKSTTLAAMIDYRNRNRAGHIITIEDPIEYMHSHRKSIVTQRELGIDTRSYQAALKNAFRQAPDVVLIGEIRDQATMETALAVADTGHLCLGTLHCTNTTLTFERIIHFFPEARHKEMLLQLSMNLKAVIAQRLVSGIDGKRLPAVEIMIDTPRMKELIKKGEYHRIEEAMEQGRMEGCQLFDSSVFDLFVCGRIDAAEALRSSDSCNNMRLRIKMHEAKVGGSSFDETDPLAKGAPNLRIQDDAA